MAHHILALLFISIEICIMVCREIWSGKAHLHRQPSNAASHVNDTQASDPNS